MQKFILLTLACTLLVSGVALALDTDQVNGTVFTDPSTPVAVKVGEDFLIALPSNPTTGYSWTAKASGSAALAVEGSAYQRPGNSRMGAGGQQIFVIEADKAGSGKIVFSYGRPWQKNVKAAKTLTFTVTAS